MNKKYSERKALMLISDEGLRNLMKPELEKCDFEVEEFLCLIQMCQVVILDYFYFQFGIGDYLREKEIRKPVYLVLNQSQIHTGNVHPIGLVRDILVVCDRHEPWESPTFISALHGEVTLQSIFRTESRPMTGMYSRKRPRPSMATQSLLLRNESWL